MPKRLLLDGEDLPALMLRVRAEMGPGARIVKAERIRKGGIGGFFARECYELVVEVPDPPSARDRWRAAHAQHGTAPGIDALLAAADAAEAGLVSTGEDVDAAVPVPVAQVEVPRPQMSTSGDTFAAVLDSVRSMVGPVGLPDPDDLEAEPEADPAVEAGPEADPAVEHIPLAITARGCEAPRTPDAVVPSQRSGAEDPALAGDEATVARLVELGVPLGLLTGFPGLTTPVPLPMLVRSFDRPPSVRLEPGAMVVVVGPSEEALRVTSQMARRARLDPRDVVLAGDIAAIAGHGRRVLTAAAAARCRSRSSYDAPTVVALGVGPGEVGCEEAAVLLDALDADQTWGVVDARARGAESRRWIRRVGAHRALDALAIFGTVEAQAPGTVLGLGTPVGWVDGLPASPVVWAALLGERLSDDVHENWGQSG